MVYDAVGNRNLKNDGSTRTTFSYDVADQLVYSQTPAGRATYVYDSAGNQQIEQPPTGSRTTTVWDNENRPVLYRLPDTSRVTMSYNADHRRVSKESAAETVKFVWDNATDAYLAEFDGANALQATYTQEPLQFGRAISQRRSATTNWYHTDALGSIRALPDISQTISDTYLYDAWGNPLSSTGTTVNPFRWVGNVGYYFDSVTGLYYIRARTYQPTIARWTSVDPLFYMLAKAGMIGFASRDPSGYMDRVSAYAYSHSAPATLVDPSGMICQSTCCCCAESISISNVQKVDGRTFPIPFPQFPGDNGILGHKYDVKIELSYKRSDNAGDCTLKWFETSNEAYFVGMVAHQEIDVFKYYPGASKPGGTTYPWKVRNKPCPGNEGMTLHDQPQTGKGFNNTMTFERYLLIRIVVESSPNCDCKSNEVWVTARQVLGVNLGRTVRAEFKSPAVPYIY